MNTLSEELHKRIAALPIDVHPIMAIAMVIRTTVAVTREFERTDPAEVDAFLRETLPGRAH